MAWDAATFNLKPVLPHISEQDVNAILLYSHSVYVISATRAYRMYMFRQPSDNCISYRAITSQ